MFVSGASASQGSVDVAYRSRAKNLTSQRALRHLSLRRRVLVQSRMAAMASLWLWRRAIQCFRTMGSKFRSRKQRT